MPSRSIEIARNRRDWEGGRHRIIGEGVDVETFTRGICVIFDVEVEPGAVIPPYGPL